jgi:1,4-alpha-glucan branching enzyme
MVSIEADGTITFTIHEPHARRVELVGAFDGWHERHLPMQRGDDGVWRIRIDPGPGACLFRYLVDDRRWRLDPEAHGICRGVDGRCKSRVYRPPLRLDPDALAA